MISARQRTAALAVDALCGLVGRRHAVRVARFALNRARLDLPNQPGHNGEHALQRWVLAAVPADEPMTVFDVGANVGDWSLALLDRARRHGSRQDLRLHAFEPSAHTCAVLRGRLPATVRVNQLALSDHAGTQTMFVTAPGAGTNSLHTAGTDPAPVGRTEEVVTGTFDEYVRDGDVGHVDLVKVDTEGHDALVLLGARTALRARAISVVQFEYNHRWVHARRYLKDVFDLVEPAGYRLGKLTPRGIEEYPRWEPELETFIEGNYVAYTPEIADRLPRIAWWKSGG